MARIEWVKSRLENWSRWVVQREAGGSGYPKQAPFARIGGVSASTESMIPVDDIDASRTHDAIEGMRLLHSPLWLAIQCHYVGDPQAPARRRRPMSTEEIAQRMLLTRRAVQQRLETADAMLAGALNRRERA